MKADNATYWHDTYQQHAGAVDEFFGELLKLLPGAEAEGMDAYDQIPRALKALRAERDALKAELAEIKRVTDPPDDGSADLPEDPADARELWEFGQRQIRWQYHMAHKFAGQVGGLRAELAECKADNEGLRSRLYYANADATRAEGELAKRDRYRLAWQSARGRASAYGESMTNLSAAWGRSEGELAEARAAIERIRERHWLIEGGTDEGRCNEDDELWPCRTITALDASHRPEDTAPAEPPTDWHVFDDGAGGRWSHPHSRADCTLPECRPAPESPESEETNDEH